jgi:ABC-2 type transport system permease protein
MMLPLIFGLPVIQLLILAYAATFEMKNIRAFIVDMDRSVASRELAGKFRGSSFYTITGYSFNYSEAENSIESGHTDLIIEIPAAFEHDLQVDKKAQIGLVTDAINGTTANLAFAYSSAIIRDYNIDLVAKLIHKKIKQPIEVRYSYWFNPELDYKTYMVPGILVLLVSMIGIFLAAINVVREKEIGTIEQINVTPIRKYQFIAGKLIPFWVIALFELAFGLLVARLFFDIPIVGSIWLIFGIAAVYMIAVLSLGLIVSTISQTMQQAMFVSWFFMVVFILMSGLFTSVDSMPEWAKTVNIINPIAYFIKIMRMVMLKGSGFRDVLNPFMALVVYSFAALWVAVWRYRKVA